MIFMNKKENNIIKFRGLTDRCIYSVLYNVHIRKVTPFPVQFIETINQFWMIVVAWPIGQSRSPVAPNGRFGSKRQRGPRQPICMVYPVRGDWCLEWRTRGLLLAIGRVASSVVCRQPRTVKRKWFTSRYTKRSTNRMQMRCAFGTYVSWCPFIHSAVQSTTIYSPENNKLPSTLATIFCLILLFILFSFLVVFVVVVVNVCILKCFNRKSFVVGLLSVEEYRVCQFVPIQKLYRATRVPSVLHLFFSIVRVVFWRQPSPNKITKK